MNDGNLAGLDLNLLVALDALVSEAHVGRAAGKLGLSQPAASHALRRLRQLLGDPLLVRAGGRMQRTARAESLKAPVADAIGHFRAIFRPYTFDPKTSTRRFSLILPDHLVDLIIPELVRRTRASAPGIRIDVRSWHSSRATLMPDLASFIDLAIACSPAELAGFRKVRLFADTEVLAVSKTHHRNRRGRLSTKKGFFEAAHIAVIAPGREEDPVDTWLREEHGMTRNICMAVPGYLQALHIASRTELVAFVPRRLAAAVAGPLGLAPVDPPIDPGLHEEFLYYPSRAAADPGSVWLRQHVAAIGRRLDIHETREQQS